MWCLVHLYGCSWSTGVKSPRCLSSSVAQQLVSEPMIRLDDQLKQDDGDRSLDMEIPYIESLPGG